MYGVKDGEEVTRTESTRFWWPEFYIGNNVWVQVHVQQVNQYTEMIMDKLKKVNEQISICR